MSGKAEVYNEIKRLRQYFVFILNYALEILRKKDIDSSDLVLFSNEVKKFHDSIDKFEIPKALASIVKRVCFNYSTENVTLSDGLYLIFSQGVSHELCQYKLTLY